MRRSPSSLSLLSLSKLCATNFSTLILFLLLSSFLLPSNAFAQGSKRKSLYDPIEENDKDRPDKRSEWLMRGRVAPKGQSAAALRLRAHQQKMAMRAARQAAAAKAGRSTTATTTIVGWVPLGPAPLVSDQSFYGDVSGRVTAIAVDPSDTTGNTVYASGASGGVWKSTNAAGTLANVTWTPVTDQQASLTNGAVSVKSDGSVVLVGTGEPDNAIDSYYGVGILRSTNKGATWTLISSADSGAHPFAGMGFTKFAWSTASANTVIAGGADAFKGDQEDLAGNTHGLYLSTNAGQTWAYQAPTDGSAPVSATDVVYNATAGKFFAALRYHGVYSSTNGTSWTRLTNQPAPTLLSSANCPTIVTGNPPTCPMYRGQLAVVPGRNETYFWFTDTNDNDLGIWQSTDGGTSWKQIDETGITACGDSDGCGTQQAFYNLEISAVADGTATDIYAGAVNLFKCKLASGATKCSTVDANLSNSWLNLTHVYGTCSTIANVHPDEHGMDFLVVGGKDIMYFGNDGGVYRVLDGFTGLKVGSCSTAGTNQFDNLNATIGSMTQFVSFSVDPTDQNTVIGGTQDNGSPATTAATTSSQFFTALGGDGGYNAIDAITPANWYNALTDVQIGQCTTAPNCNDFAYNEVVSSATLAGDHGAFYTPYILDPQDSSEMLVGTCRVWRGAASGAGFSTLSVNFDTGAATGCNGGEINQITELAAGGPKDVNGFSNVVYATSNGYGPLFGFGTGGLVAVTTNAATTQMSDVTGAINPNNYAISSVAIDNSDATGNTAYVGIMGFNTSHVWKTTTAGASGWTDWTGSGLPDSPVDALLVDSQAGLIYAGTDVGIFVSSTSSASWTEVGPAPGSGQAGYLPNVPVSAIRIFNSGGIKKLRVSTYGRGIWEYSLAASSATTTTLASSQNPSNFGSSVTFTATVTTTGLNAPTGTVTFNDGTTALGTGTLSTSSPYQATLTTSSLPSGSHSITAVYGGDSNNAGSTSAVLTQVIVAPTFTITTPTTPSTLLSGQSTMSSTFKVTPTGTTTVPITFVCNGLPDATITCSAPSIAAPATGVQTVTLTITTAGPNSGTVTPQHRRAENRSPWLPFTLPLAGIVMVGFAGRKVSKHFAIAGLCASLALLGLLIACGGSNPPVTISVSPAGATVFASGPTGDGWPPQTATFTPTVNNTSNTAVNWSLTSTVSCTGTPSPCGSIPGGVYTAPTAASGLPGSVTITATSQADSTKTATATVTIKPTTVPGSYPLTVTATEGPTQNTTGQFTLTVQ